MPQATDDEMALAIASVLIADRDPKSALAIAKEAHRLVAAEVDRKVCPQCGKDFYARFGRADKKRCSAACTRAAGAQANNRRRGAVQP
jgi:hypothetical protein